MSSDARDYSVMMTTAADRGEAERLARLLLERKLAACVQLSPIDSVYVWDGALKTGSEVLLLIKTRSVLVPSAMTALKAVHSYETPEIIALPMAAGLPDYLRWIDAATT